MKKSPIAAHSVVCGSENIFTHRFPAMVRILIADEHQLFRDCLRRLLEVEPELQVAGEASDGLEAIALTRQLRPDILLIALSLPTVSGLRVLEELDDMRPDTATVLLAASIAPSELMSALHLGARGIIMKQWPAAELVAGIRQLADGQYWIGRQSSSTLMLALRQLSLGHQGSGRRDFGLTRRELEVTAAIVAAYSNKLIAQKFCMSEKTVKHHLTNIFDKVGVSTRLELAAFAHHHALTLPNLDRQIQ